MIWVSFLLLNSNFRSGWTLCALIPRLAKVRLLLSVILVLTLVLFKGLFRKLIDILAFLRSIIVVHLSVFDVVGVHNVWTGLSCRRYFLRLWPNRSSTTTYRTRNLRPLQRRFVLLLHVQMFNIGHSLLHFLILLLLLLFNDIIQFVYLACHIGTELILDTWAPTLRLPIIHSRVSLVSFHIWQNSHRTLQIPLFRFDWIKTRILI